MLIRENINSELTNYALFLLVFPIYYFVVITGIFYSNIIMRGFHQKFCHVAMWENLDYDVVKFHTKEYSPYRANIILCQLKKENTFSCRLSIQH